MQATHAARPRYCALAREAVADGLIGYGLMIAKKV